MSITNVFMTKSSKQAPQDGSSDSGAGDDTKISDFLSVQALANFGAMTGGITAAWHALASLNAQLATLWVPYGFALLWGVTSIVMSSDALKKNGNLDAGKIIAVLFVALINVLVLGSAVVGTGVPVIPPSP